jgi:hypothetical protein
MVQLQEQEYRNFTLGSLLSCLETIAYLQLSDLQKYSFTFNQETKMIGYYNFDLPGGVVQDDEEKKSIFQNVYVWIGISVVVVVFAVLGFFIGKFVYDKVRKKRINEVDDDNYEYASQQNKEDNKLCDSINA